MSPGQAEDTRGRLEAFANSLLEASITVPDQEERAAFDGSADLDAPVPLFSLGPSKRAGLSASDPDGGWYVRDGDHRDREDEGGKPLRKDRLCAGGHHRSHRPAARRAGRLTGLNGQPLAPSAMPGPPSIARVYRSRILIPVWLNRKPTGPPRSRATSLITAARPSIAADDRSGPA